MLEYLRIRSPRAARASWTRAALALATLAGCQETVLMGTECPPDGAGCAIRHEGGEVAILPPTLPWDEAPEAPVAQRDGGVAESPDGATQVPEGADSGGDLPLEPEAYLNIMNPSFERDGGIGGDVVLTNLVDSVLFLPIPVVDQLLMRLPYWYACVPFNVSSLSLLADPQTGETTVSELGDYLSFVINGTSVRQQLPEPLVPGVTYAFEVSVMSDTGGANNVFVEARGANTACGDAYVLGRSPHVADSTSWSTTCLEFTADQAFPYLLFAPGYDGSAPPVGARFRLDGLRQVARCPAR